MSSSQPYLCVSSPLEIECIITLNTAIGPDLSVVNYYWYHNDSLIEGSNINIIASDDQMVFTTQISISLPGTYTCKANITSSDQTKSALLDVQFKGTTYFYVLTV